MGKDTVAWPTHGHAVNARNDTAENLLGIMDELSELQRLVEKGEVTRLDVTLAINRMQQAVTASLLLMIQQGAPVRPGRLTK